MTTLIRWMRKVGNQICLYQYDGAWEDAAPCIAQEIYSEVEQKVLLYTSRLKLLKGLTLNGTYSLQYIHCVKRLSISSWDY